MENFITMDLLFRWLHVLFGITWIGLLYYFNFIQGEYFKEAKVFAKSDAVQKLAPRVLWWFRWGAMGTFLTGLILLVSVYKMHGIDGYIMTGALLGTLMFLNVWLIIWPNQKIVCGIEKGDASVAGPKALLASRTNTLFSGPMLMGMMGSFHGPGAAGDVVLQTSSDGPMSMGLMTCLALIIALEANGIYGKTGPFTSVKGVVHCSIGLTVVMLALLQFV